MGSGEKKIIGNKPKGSDNDQAPCIFCKVFFMVFKIFRYLEDVREIL